MTINRKALLIITPARHQVPPGTTGSTGTRYRSAKQMYPLNVNLDKTHNNDKYKSFFC